MATLSKDASLLPRKVERPTREKSSYASIGHRIIIFLSRFFRGEIFRRFRISVGSEGQENCSTVAFHSRILHEECFRKNVSAMCSLR